MRTLLASFVLLIALFLLNLFFGSISLPASEIWQAVCFADEADSIARFVVYQSRIPAILTAILAGSALAASGLTMQTLFGNPLADPSMLGINAGAALGAAIAMLVLGGSVSLGGISLSGFLLTIGFAFIGAMLVTLLLLLCSVRLRSNLLLLITGIMVSFVVSALISLLSFFATTQGVHSFTLWGLGDFGGVTMERLLPLALFIIPSLSALLLFVKPLNALLLGHSYATNLGFNVVGTRTFLLFITGLLTAVVTAACGPISFIGLAVPHIARLLLHTANHRLLLPVTMLWGAIIALLCLFITRLPADGIVLPLGAITPMMGVPVVLYILFRRREAL